MFTKFIRSSDAADLQVGIDSYVDAFCDFIASEGLKIKAVRRHRNTAIHFLIWLRLSQVKLETTDADIITQFMQHQCNCCDRSTYRLTPWVRRNSYPELIVFVRYLEQVGCIRTAGDLQQNLELVDRFLSYLCAQGYAPKTVALYRIAAFNLILWMHFSRNPLCSVTPAMLAQYRNKQFLCSVPGLFCARNSRFPAWQRTYLKGFVDYLADTGHIKRFDPTEDEKPYSDVLTQFARWMKQHRGAGLTTVNAYVNQIQTVLPVMGDDPSAYSTALIHQVVMGRVQVLSVNSVRNFTGALRMYLRFLISQDMVSPTLLAAIPSIRKPSLSDLPRYISDDDVDCIINSCKPTKTGMRDRAILLLLSALALRAGDIVHMRISDIDWKRAQIRVSGKSSVQVALPLPQDVGDALHDYLTKARPPVDVDQVFVGSKAPHRPFNNSSTVSCIARRALNRHHIAVPAGCGAHVFRHSRATSLLRSGASLNEVQCLLRHASADITMIYAKTNVQMLQEVAQPWIGRSEG